MLSLLLIQAALLWGQTFAPAPATPPTRMRTPGTCYQVIRIDSVTTNLVKFRDPNPLDKFEGAFVIYATYNGETFKIISPRNLATYHKCLVVGRCYRFQLTSYFAQRPGEPIDMTRSDGMIVNGVSVYREPAIVDDLFFDDRLENLCFKTSKEGRH